MGQQAQAEQSIRTQYIPPKSEYAVFLDEDHYKEKLKEWGLSSAKEAKREFWYKERGQQCLVSIKGYETYGKGNEFNTLVIEFPDGNISCIHPAFLKEMQQSSFGRESLLILEENASPKVNPSSSTQTVAVTEPTQLSKTDKPVKEKVAKPAKEAKPKKEKAAKLELPADKVHFTAKVKQFALVYNHFNEENDEAVVLEDVQIQGENPLDIGLAWCSHSKTLKKFELAIEDLLEFDGKVAAKKMAKGKDAPEEFQIDTPVLYKINNPSKITKK